MRKILFLDVDGVVNSKDTVQRSTRGVIGIDPYLAFLVGKIQLDTDCEVVLSSSWRKFPKGREEVEKAVCRISDVTGSSFSGLRGVEIHEWLERNVEDFTSTYKGDFRIAILDDSSDMLLWQAPHFFRTSWNTGITPEIAEAVTNHLNS